jgi:cation transport regulator ChaB
MPYSQIADLPPEVRDSLTVDEQDQWMAVFNAVYAQTQDEEKAILAAWGAVRKGRALAGRSVALQEADGLVIVRGWGVLFTDAAHTDYYGTHFSTLSHLLAEYYQDAPLWYEHGLDADYGVLPIGKRHQVEIYGFGVWAEHTLFPDHRLYERTVREIEEGQLAYSSDSIAHYVEQGLNLANGELRMWPLAGWSLTRQPAEEGLGPVTLAGMEATIREVTQAPARRIPLEGGRAILTLTTCKSVYDPPRDPTVPAEPSDDDPAPATADAPVPTTQAREAHGGDEPTPSYPTLVLRGVPMDPKTLAALADFLGVDATPEAVLAALHDLIALLEGPGDDTMAGASTAVDGNALRAALQLDANAPDENVIAALTDLAVFDKQIVIHLINEKRASRVRVKN